MAMSEERYNQIKDFFDGKFSDAKSQEFRQEISRDGQLAEDLAFFRLEREMMDAMLDEDMSAKMKEWKREEDALPSDRPPVNVVPPKPRSDKKWLLLLLPLLAIGVWWILKPTTLEQASPPSTKTPTQTTPTEEQPSTQPPVAPPDTPTKPPIAQNGPSDAELEAILGDNKIAMAYIPASFRGAADDLSKAEKERKAGRYEAAIALYEKVSKDSTDKGLEASFNLAVLYFELKRYKQAIPYFRAVTARTDFAYLDDAQYSLALCYMATRQFDKAEKELDKMLGRADFEYREKAAVLRKWVLGFDG
jgi:Tetratricopeptide repeat